MVKKSIVDSTMNSFQIDASNSFEIRIDTHDTDAVIVEATIDGEYSKDLVLSVKEVGPTVMVNAGFRPNFENPNDKLSAHKVVSIALRIQVPAHKNVRLFGTNCTIQATGVYEKLKVTLNDGASYLNKVEGYVEVNTQSGDIIVKSNRAEIHGVSKYGKILGDQIPKGNTKYVLHTVTGNIRLKRIE